MRLFNKRNAKRTHLYSRWAYKRGGGYIRVGLYPEIKYSLANGWGLKSEILRYIKSHLSVELGSKKLYKFESCLLI